MPYHQTCSAAALIFLAIAGCGQHATDTPSMPTAPETIKSDGQIWNRIQPIERQEQLLLSRHFGKKPSLAENPIFRGTMAVYQAKDGRRRFYWLSRLEADVAWLYLEFDERGRFLGMREGMGPLLIRQPPELYEQ